MSYGQLDSIVILRSFIIGLNHHVLMLTSFIRL